MNHASILLLLAGVPTASLALAAWFGPAWPRLPWALVAATAIIAICLALVVYGLWFSTPGQTTPALSLERRVGALFTPSFLLLPAAVSYLASSLLLRSGLSLGSSRLCSALAGLGAFAIGAIGSIAAGCGLAGACF